jgi:hypothetical protein
MKGYWCVMVKKLNRIFKRKNTEHPYPFLRIPLNGNDYRGIPTTVCPCGVDQFIILAGFSDEERLVSWYALDGVCAGCGSLISLPCPADLIGA